MKKKNILFMVMAFMLMLTIGFVAVGCSVETTTTKASIEEISDYDEDISTENNSNYETTYDMYTTLVQTDDYDGTYYEFLTEVLGEDYSISKLMNKSLLNVVSIEATWSITTSSMGPWRGSSTSEESAAGTGVFYSVDKESGDAYIMTCYHVIYNSDANTNNGISTDINCYLYGQEYEDYKMEATFVGGSISNDIAVLKITGSDIIKNSLAEAVTFASNETTYIGEDVYAVGNNYAEGISANAGNISLLSADCSYTIGNTSVNIRCIRTDCAINGGNSGGALFNEYGQLVGIVNCKIESEEVDNMTYAIPTTIVKGMVKNIIKSYESNSDTTVKKAYLGISIQIENAHIFYNNVVGAYQTTGDIVIYSIESSSIVKDVLKVGDIIKEAKINDESMIIRTVYDLSEFLYNASYGDELELTIIRDDITYLATITLNNMITVQ